jgi:hypothetical protein
VGDHITYEDMVKLHTTLPKQADNPSYICAKCGRLIKGTVIVWYCGLAYCSKECVNADKESVDRIQEELEKKRDRR